MERILLLRGHVFVQPLREHVDPDRELWWRGRLFTHCLLHGRYRLHGHGWNEQWCIAPVLGVQRGTGGYGGIGNRKANPSVDQGGPDQAGWMGVQRYRRRY